MPLTITDLRAHPSFAPHVSDRVWRAFWEPKAEPLSVVETLTHGMLATKAPTPFCLVAYDGITFAGTVSLIESDLADRPELTPWIAAVWVEPASRGKGVATALLKAAVATAAQSSFSSPYLFCRKSLRPFYEQRGWRLFEDDAPDPSRCILRLHH